jgi:hypothetical protein
MIAVGEVDVRMAPAQEHGAIPRRGPTKMMSGRIARRISFGFDDAADEPAGGEFSHHDLADKEASEGHRPGRQLGPAEAANQDAGSATLHNALRLSLDVAQIKSFNRWCGESIQPTGRV